MIKYLEEIGVKGDSNVDSRLFPDESDERRRKRFKDQVNDYGFDERETWDLRYTSACWLYQHIRMYKDIAKEVIDMSFYKFNVIDENDSEIVLTQWEAINKIIELLERFIKYENKTNVFESTDDEEMDAQKALCTAFMIYGEIVPAMWW